MFATPGAPSSEIIVVDTRPSGVLPDDWTAMTRTLTGRTTAVSVCDRDYFPLTIVLLFLHGGDSGWRPDLKSTVSNKPSLAQWTTQLMLREPRFQQLGPMVNEFLIDVSIEDQRLSFHAHNQEKYRTSLHHAAANSRLPRSLRDSSRGKLLQCHTHCVLCCFRTTTVYFPFSR